MPVHYNAQPPQLLLDAVSLSDFRRAALNQRFFGGIHVGTGMVYLVAGQPRLMRRFGRDPHFARTNITSHAFIPVACRLMMVRGMLGGFSVTKKLPLQMVFRSSFNEDAFIGQPDNFYEGGEDRLTRTMPSLWAAALRAFLPAQLN